MARKASAMAVPRRNARMSGNRARATNKERTPPEQDRRPVGGAMTFNGPGRRLVTSADIVPVGGRRGLERVRLGLLVAAALLVEAAGDHLVGHRLRNPELGQRLDLVGHDLVAGRLDRDEDL